MTRNIKKLVLAGAIAGAAFGCKNPSDARNEAREAQLEASKKTAEATGEAQKDMQETTDKAREEAAKAQASANDKIREANRETAEQRADLREWGQKKIDEVDHLIDETKVKAQTAAPKVRSDFNSAIHDVELRRDALRSELASLETRAGTEVGNAKDALDGRISQLKDRIREIRRTL
jgi:hypothetical protein